MTNILLIDDDDVLRNTVSKVLEQNNFSVTGLKDGSKAIAEIKSKKYDIVVTDIVMPNKEGIETIQDIRHINPHIPILAVSGGGLTGADTILELAIMMGANGSLTKPFDTAVLVRKITELLDRE